MLFLTWVGETAGMKLSGLGREQWGASISVPIAWAVAHISGNVADALGKKDSAAFATAIARAILLTALLKPVGIFFGLWEMHLEQKVTAWLAHSLTNMLLQPKTLLGISNGSLASPIDDADHRSLAGAAVGFSVAEG